MRHAGKITGLAAYGDRRVAYDKVKAMIWTDGLHIEVSPLDYTLRHEYLLHKKLTGISVILNTSFNMHEEPIVCSPQDAIRSFTQDHLDYLAIGDYLVKFKENR
ncbi:MAG: carbamoyltransferase C-terminal domain-containing protein [bacterium]|nr:carbamoyltransferase C-terminal domain-containing protein [bacterium]